MQIDANFAEANWREFRELIMAGRVWPMATVWRRFSAAGYCAESISRLRSAVDPL